MEREKMLEAALKEIAIGRGPFSRDPQEHADNCIDAMKQVARDALNGTYEPAGNLEQDYERWGKTDGIRDSKL